MTCDDREIQASDKKEETGPREKDSSDSSCGCGCVSPIETK